MSKVCGTVTMFRAKFVEEFKTHFTLNNFFFIKSCCVVDNVEKHGTAGQATDDKMAHVHYMQYN